MKRSGRFFFRLCKLVVGLLFMAAGVICTVKANLGTSPIASVPYVMEAAFPLSIGLWTIIFSLVLMVVQLILSRFQMSAAFLLQLPVSILFGLFTDACLILFHSFTSGDLTSRILFLLLGCISLTIGVKLETTAALAMLPGEATARVVADVASIPFGIAKVITDLCMVLSASLLSVLLLGHLQGVGIGTVVAAVSVGTLCRLSFRKPRTSSPDETEQKN